MANRAPFWKRPAGFLPPEDGAAPLALQRLLVFPLVFIPWLVLYEAIVFRGPPPGAFQTYLPGELHWPIWQWAEIFYVSPYVLVTLAPLIVPTNRLLRRFIISAWIMTALIDTIFITVPAIAPFRPFSPHGILGWMMTQDRIADRNNGTAAFPSFHVVWSFMGAMLWSARMPRWRGVWLAWAAAVSLSCVFTGMHALLDVVAGFGVFLLTWWYAPVARAGELTWRPFVRAPASSVQSERTREG